ncbi:unnamed protein product [Schistosoma mattheei]|uniref:Uncharacterized protein n=1 Tax=Schistosoma mattheei TaxID=31246 RepID=A0A183P6M9_9TREM|nr:unnamed protein product [Schistosoma mattheei]
MYEDRINYVFGGCISEMPSKVLRSTKKWLNHSPLLFTIISSSQGLSVCLPSQISTFDQHSATIYSVTGASRNPFSEYEENLSCKISKRFHCPVFVSISLPHEFASLWNHFNVITQSTLGQKAEHCIFENLSTIVLS